jgi:hypothetical protein
MYNILQTNVAEDLHVSDNKMLHFADGHSLVEYMGSIEMIATQLANVGHKMGNVFIIYKFYSCKCIKSISKSAPIYTIAINVLVKRLKVAAKRCLNWIYFHEELYYSNIEYQDEIFETYH